MTLRLLILVSCALVLCSAVLPGRSLDHHHLHGPRHHKHGRLSSPGANIRRLPSEGIPDHGEISRMVERTQQQLGKMADDVHDWPAARRRRLQQQQRQRDQRGHRGHGRHTDRVAADRPGATGASINIILDGLFTGLEDMMQPLTSLDLGAWGLNWFGGKKKEPWYRGPNVCESREEKEEDLTGEIERHQVTTTSVCDELDSAYKCTVSMNVYGKKTTVIVTYTCCYGYERVKGEPGCPKELQLEGLATTAQNLGLDQLLEAVQSTQLQDALTQQNFTVFAPTDEAFIKLKPDDMPLSNVVVVSPELRAEANQLREVILGHLVSGFEPSTSMSDEQVYDTVYPRGTIRINHYNAPVKMTTANCVRVTSADNLATNGVIHVVDSVLPIVTDNALDLIRRNPELRTLASLISRTGLSDTLRGEGQFTIFAPTEEAFRRLNQDTRDYLLQANSCLKKALQSHVLPNVICSSIIQSRGKTLNVLGEYLELNRTYQDEVYVDGGSRVVKADMMATNAVIHFIDKVIVPKQVLNIVDMARDAGATAVLDLIQKAGLTKTLRELEGFTMFVPTNEAIESLPAGILQALIRDADLLTDVLKYHVVKQDLRGRDLYNDLQITTLLGDKKKITVKEYSSFPFSMQTVKTVQCAPLATVDMQSCNAVAHVVNKVLLPPAGDLVDVLAQDSRFSRLVSVLKAAGLAEMLQRGPYTVFAPTNEAFDQVDPVLLRSLAEDKDKLKAFLAHHVTHDTLCCSGMSIHSAMGWFWKPVEMTLDPGSNVVFDRTRDGTIEVDGVPIVSCDMTATNGVVHAIANFLPSAATKYGLSLQVSPAGRQKAPVKYQF